MDLPTCRNKLVTCLTGISDDLHADSLHVLTGRYGISYMDFTDGLWGWAWLNGRLRHYIAIGS